MKTPTRPTTIPKRGYSITQAAEYCGLKKGFIERQVAAGKLPHRIIGAEFNEKRFSGRRVPGIIIILRETLDTLLEQAPSYGSF